MGSGSCKHPKSSEQNQKKDDIKQITIGVFGLDNAGKTSTVKALEGAPTKNVTATMSSNISTVPYPVVAKGDKKSQERIKIIDLSGEKKFRERSWPEYYDQIHGFIFVIDASEKKRITENKDTLDDLLDDNKLRDKPILILANKQDRRGAIDDEDHIKNKLQIETLKTKHKIEFCTALPQDNNKPDESIRKGFSWLIKTIESNYTELNSRVNNIKKPNPPKPADRKTQMNNKQKHEKSDESDNDDDVVYNERRRTDSPPLNKKTTDYRSTKNPTILPSLDLNKIKKKPSGHDTYSENDDDDDIIRSRSNVARPESDRTDRSRSLNPPNISATSGLNKKKKVIGAANSNNDLPYKKSNPNEPKSFRSTYEPFPEDALWSSSKPKPTKNDSAIPPIPYLRPSITNDLSKRNISPLIHDTKLSNSGSLSKRNNASDDDDDFSRREKAKSTYPSINRDKDNENQKFSSSLSTNRPSSSTFKKPALGIYGADDDDDLKRNDTYRRSNVTTPTTKKPYKHDDDSDNENKYLKKSTSKGFGSDDDDRDNSTNKNYQRPTDRSMLSSDYRGITATKPSPSTTITAARPKSNEYDFPLPPALLSKPLNRAKGNNDDYLSTSSKPKPRSKLDDDDPPPYSSKPITQSKYSDDDDDYKFKPKPAAAARPKYDDNYDLPSSTSKLGTRSNYNNDYSASSKPTTRLKHDDNDRPSSPFRSATRSKYSDDDLPLPSSKPTIRSKFDDDDDLPSKSKPAIRSKYDNDDDDPPPWSSSKAGTRSKYGDDDRSFPSVKPTSRSRFDDDDDRPSLSSKVPTRSKFDDDDDRPSPSSKIPSRSKYDDDDDDRPLPSSKAPIRSKFDDDDDRPSPSSKIPSRSKYDDDDDDRPSPSSKTPIRSKYSDDDRSASPVKPNSRSKFDDDDDDYPSSSKKNNSSSRDDNYSGSGGARSRFGNNDFDSARSGSNNARIGSASTQRFRTNANFDD